jgi:hypothetical protein
MVATGTAAMVVMVATRTAAIISMRKASRTTAADSLAGTASAETEARLVHIRRKPTCRCRRSVTLAMTKSMASWGRTSLLRRRRASLKEEAHRRPPSLLRS